MPTPLAPYKESKDGQILQEGICETGAMASFLAAGTAYANYGLPMIPFYIFYSIFGFPAGGGHDLGLRGHDVQGLPARRYVRGAPP